MKEIKLSELNGSTQGVKAGDFVLGLNEAGFEDSWAWEKAQRRNNESIFI